MVYAMVAERLCRLDKCHISQGRILFFRELWREENAMEQSLQNTRDELGRNERNYRSTMSKVC